MSAEHPYPEFWAAPARTSPADSPADTSAGSSLTALLRCLGDKVELHQRKIRAQQELIVELIDAVGALASQLQAQTSSDDGSAAREAPVSTMRPGDHRDSAYCPPNTYYDTHRPLKGRKEGATAPSGLPRRTARRPAWDPTPLRPQPRVKSPAVFASMTSGPPRRRSEASSSLGALQAELQRRGGPGRR
jgi:hypothetical protein